MSIATPECDRIAAISSPSTAGVNVKVFVDRLSAARRLCRVSPNSRPNRQDGTAPCILGFRFVAAIKRQNGGSMMPAAVDAAPTRITSPQL
jgi:hypothetical protein